MNCPIPPAHSIMGLLVCSVAYEFGQWALGSPGSGNMLLQMGMSSFFKKKEPTASLGVDPGLQP